MTESHNKLNNPLLNASVTGSTFEEFSQNALLLPAQEKIPVESSAVLRQEEQIKENQEPLKFQQGSENIDEFENFQLPINQYQSFANQQQYQSPQQEQEQSTNFSTVFSTFSNILKLDSGTNLPEINQPILPPAEINRDALNVQPVPLYTPINSYANTSPNPSPKEPINSFRRAKLKRPVYAQIPGLVKPAESIPFQSASNVHGQPSILSADFSINAQQNTSFLNPVITPSIPLIPSLPSNTFNSSSLINPSNSIQTPVMAAIPANEIPQTQDNLNIITGEPSSIVSNTSSQIYRPIYHHWFHKKELEGKTLWQPFTMVDSLALEEVFISNDLDPDKVVSTDGGRFDVNILRRQRIPVYWKGSLNEVRRCSWFHRGNSDGKYVPYEENIATKLEEEYKIAFESNQWHRKVEIPGGEVVVFHAPDVLVLLPPTQSPDAWGNTPNQTRPRIVKRGMDEFNIDEGEPPKVDHLLFLVHGIGSVCDLKFRTVEEVVDEFRSTSLQLVQAHYRSSCEKGIANRVEVLPISWHEELHSEDTGIDKKLKSITLESIPRLRDFTNDTLLDILFYTSPVYCQTIVSTVGNELNRVYELFKQRNPSFDGGVSLGGHSLGSLILFDLLCHQHPEPEPGPAENDEDTVSPLTEKLPPAQRKMSRRISYMMGTVGTGQPQIHYPHLNFQAKAFFALGSPIGMFVTVRGLDALGEQFALPTCPGFFNIFHPYDPVAYRIESLINPDLANLKPVLIPHHKGRKRMHLELKETMTRVGADLKQRVVDSMKSTWNSFYQLAIFHRQDQPSLEEEVNKAFTERLLQEEQQSATECDNMEQQPTNAHLGMLNQGKRIDYVLQEAPFEFFNEYIFALSSHVCYWESEDTMLLILKEIYSSMNISADDKIPQQSMTIERPPPSPKSARCLQVNLHQADRGVDPTVPLQQNNCLGPPPTSGFVKKN